MADRFGVSREVEMKTATIREQRRTQMDRDELLGRRKGFGQLYNHKYMPILQGQTNTLIAH